MKIPDWINIAIGIAGLLVGITGLFYGYHQNRLKERIERLATLQAWEVYQSAYQALGWLNNALDVNGK